MRALWLALTVAVLAHAEDPLLWGRLEPGPNGVGYRSFIELDGSRKYDGKARPILFQVWYPAFGPDTPGIPYEQYLRVPNVSAHPKFRARLEQFVRDVLADDLFHEKTEAALNNEESTALRTLLSTRTAAHLEATPLPGPFPVVLYHAGAGGSFADNSVLFEYLASNGYVVVSSAFESQVPELVANNRGGIERSGPDLNFLARLAHEWPYADSSKLGAIGHSAGAQLLLEWIGSPKCPAKAIVSLDTTIEYHPELHKYMRERMSKLPPPRIAVLLFAQARLNPDFSPYDRYLGQSLRYEAQADEVSHDGFVTYGFLGRTLTRDPNAGAVRRSYEAVCRTIRAFLDASLRSDVEAAQALEHADPSSPVKIQYRAPR
jgi:hypothetical protein